MYPCQSVGKTEIIRSEVERSAIADELKLILATALKGFFNTKQDHTGALAADVDVRNAEVRGDLRVEAERTADAGVEDTYSDARGTESKVVYYRRRENVRLAKTYPARIAKLIAGAES